MPFKIQIVEDERVTATLLSKKLTDVGFEVSIAFDGASALKQIQEFKPDLILLDFFLPSGDGLSVLTKLRSTEQSPTPVFVLSSGIEQHQKDKLASQGISGYWEKPFNINTLIAEIKKILSPKAGNSPKTILIVDDDLDIQKIIKISLTSKGYDAVSACDGQAALQAVAIHNPDLIILDLTMPDFNGWKFSQLLRQDEKYAKYKNIPIIVLSALVAEEGPTTLRSQGDFLMAKPFELDKMLDKIKELIN